MPYDAGDDPAKDARPKLTPEQAAQILVRHGVLTGEGSDRALAAVKKRLAARSSKAKDAVDEADDDFPSDSNARAILYAGIATPRSTSRRAYCPIGMTG
jgi:hypothetical protein